MATNKVIIGGIGNVPTDMGVSDNPHPFAPRIGIAYRPTERWVIRAGYGINADPYSLARPFRTNYPVLVDQNFVAPNSYAYVGRTEDGIPPVPIPTLGNGVIDIPGNVSAKTLDTNFRRGYDPAAFAPVTAVRYGTSGLNILRGPGVANVDLGLFRQFSLTVRWKLQFRAEAFNATNTAHFNNPGTNVSNAIFGSNGSITRTNGYTEITSAQADQRQLRFGLRVSF